MSCSLWDEYSEQMFEYIKQNEAEVHVVLIVQFGSFTNYKGLSFLAICITFDIFITFFKKITLAFFF